MLSCYPAPDVAEAIKAMGDTHQPSQFLCVAMWFKAVPLNERAVYHAEVENCLKSLSIDGKADSEIGVLNRVLRHCKVPMPDERRRLAVLMAAHTRLGAGSTMAALGDLIPVIAGHALFEAL